MDIQLSISLLASDCPAALERCLNSLKPLMMQVPCELIVVMTGTDKKIREIASNYTEQIGMVLHANRGRRISLGSRSAWSTKWVPG